MQVIYRTIGLRFICKGKALNTIIIAKTERNDSWNPISNNDKGSMPKQTIPAKPKEFKGSTLRFKKNPNTKKEYIRAARNVGVLAPVIKVYA